MNSKLVRQQFLDFFKSKSHTIVDSSPVVPFDDPTLMFTNAGMNQFKDVFLGTGSRPYKRAADTQKCIRAGGKHNDLDDVGRDTYHHTFFEMLGNWSFGDYFKKEAIEWAWELLTKVWGVDRSRLHATYFQGDPAEGLEPDSDAAQLWRTVTDIDPSHIHPGNKKDNFWEMGETGPCGPCSEIHIDLTPDKSGGKLVNAGDARVMEIWNLVFIQFNRGTDGKLTPLPAKHVDTGMGFERICSVLQGMEANRIGAFSNYDTDVFTPIFDAIRARTHAPAYTGTLPDQYRDRKEAGVDQLMIDVSYRVIADHLRCLTFAITDGALPSNEGRGYVLRRILRRAVRYARQYLNRTEPFLCDLVDPLVQHMGAAFPELKTAHGHKNPKHVADILRDEEASFIKTLDRGIKLFNDAAVSASEQFYNQASPSLLNSIDAYIRQTTFRPSPMLMVRQTAIDWSGFQGPVRPKISGEAAFKLHDTYGFPIDLTEQMAEERGLTVDIGEYERLMDEAREKARDSSTPQRMRFESALVGSYRIFNKTDDSPKYSQLEHESEITTFFGPEAPSSAMELREGQKAVMILRSTCFYAEQGGQVGDTGLLRTETGEFEVLSTHREQTEIEHHGVVKTGVIQRRQKVRGVVSELRIPTMQNHTSTHILNWALREVLGEHVQQKGSLVDPEKTRFDFPHPKALGDKEMAQIEDLCNQQIAAKLPVYAASREEDFVDQKEARKINTLRAVFGEKYPDRVRVVSIGIPITEDDAKKAGVSDWLLKSPDNPKWMKYSVEFCGGTHVKNTGDIEEFVLTHEEAVAKGIRRLVGISGSAARDALTTGQNILAEIEVLCRAGSTRHGEPRALARAAQSPSGDPPTGGTAKPQLGSGDVDLHSRLSDFQQRLSAATIPLRTRHQINEKLAALQKILKEHEKRTTAAAGDAVLEKVKELLPSAQSIHGVTVLVTEVPSATPDALRTAIDWVRNKTPASAVLLASVSEGKVTLLAGMSKTVVDKGLRAGDLIKDISPLVGGKGGGRPDLAQGGGPNPDVLPTALNQCIEWLKQRLT